jgi:hypothetical protein
VSEKIMKIILKIQIGKSHAGILTATEHQLVMFSYSKELFLSVPNQKELLNLEKFY